MKIRFALLAEGTTDLGLVPHLEALCVRFGADEATGIAPDLGRLRPPPGARLGPRLRALLGLAPDLDLVFMHRDADRAGVAARRGEIAAAIAEARCEVPVVPIIPVTMVEAWMLVDADALRAAVGRPRGRGTLSLPKPAQIEAIGDPKALLRGLLTQASGASGRRLRALNTDEAFSANRRFLLERLDLDGAINTLPSWQTLLRDLRATLATLGVNR